eukprot:TRINITY_DN5237_c0_g1_i1.p1 TRINITY_DN5237_c0_g1~~TRINITY_DN5237_c0_g1_i1.p1  ORF type:complete len:403 (+),score=121.69 TRINITY_DN5237_c0_g1_i1:129-1337(+)
MFGKVSNLIRGKGSEEKLGSNELNNNNGDSGISMPFDFKPMTHVTSDLNWTISDLEAFTLGDQIGKGAYGHVFRASLLKGRSHFIAAKRIIVEEDNAEAIKREVDILRQCHHEFIVNYLGCIIDDSIGKAEGKALAVPEGKKTLWILMDYCGAGSVKDFGLAGTNTLDEDKAAFVLEGALRGLEYLHSQNIVHRDLKCANILVTDEGIVKIADFGISRRLEESLKAKTMTGSPYWMAPEILEGSYDKQVDIWSLGITAIEMLENKPPNWHVKPFQLMLRMPKDPPPSFRNPEKVSRGFLDFVTRCLQKDPSLRPSATELLQDPWLLESASRGSVSLKEFIGLNIPRSEPSSARNSMVSSPSGSSSLSSSQGASMSSTMTQPVIPPRKGLPVIPERRVPSNIR